MNTKNKGGNKSNSSKKIILILGILFAIVVLPIMALIAFGVTSTLTNQVCCGSNSVTTTPCVGVDDTGGDETGKAFIGFADEYDRNVCILTDANGKTINRDSDYDTDRNEGISEVKTGDSISILDTVVNIARIVLYCSILLIPITLIGVVLWYVTTSQKEREKSK